MDTLQYRVGNLSGQPFLDLQPTGEQIGQSGQFGQANDLPVGDISNVHVSREGDHMMFTQGMDIDVPDDHHFVVIFAKDGVVRDLTGGQMIPVA